MEAIIVSVITGICSVVGVLLTTHAANRRLQHQLEISQAVLSTRLDSLTDEVRTLGNAARRVPAVEERVRAAELRVERLERGLRA